MPTGYDDTDVLALAARSEAYLRADRAKTRHRTIVLVVAIVVVALGSLCVGISDYGLIYSPADVAGCIGMWFELNIGSVFVPSLLLDQRGLLDAYPMYYEVTTRVAYTFVTIVCGALLALAGMLYQNAFRNPIAAPTMLGVSSGINIGCVALVMVYGTLATSLTEMRLVYCFIGGLAVLAIVMVFGKLASGRRPLNMVNVLLVATIVSSLLNTVVNYIVNYSFNETQWSIYYDVSNVTDLDTSPLSLVVVLVAAVVSCLPVFLCRFPLNCIAFGDEDMKLFGVNPLRYRILALGCGSLMIIVAQTFVGAAAMISLVVPFAARAIFGTEFRKQMLGNVLIGILLLLVCRLLLSFIPFVGDGIPLGTMVTFVTLPAFVWVMVIAQRQWRD